MNKRLLLVEDHDGLRRIIGSFLSKEFEVVGAKNGLEAMCWLQNGVQPDIIITDSAMPELDGAALLSNLRCSGMWADIPVVVLGSGKGDETMEAQQFMQLGAYEYFPKPFSPTRLQERLMDIIG